MTIYEMDEQTETEQYQEKLVKDVLGLSPEAFDRFKVNAVKGLISLGNAFKQALGVLLQEANVQESVKIMSVWRKECAEYEMLYRIQEAKLKALKEVNENELDKQNTGDAGL
jgi:hypothetical protein